MDKRIFIKISGEMLSNNKHSTFDQKTIESYAAQIQTLYSEGFQLALGVGGGNIVRGREIAHHVGRVYSDYIGVLGTVMNGLYLKSVLEKMGMKTRLFSAVVVPEIAEKFEPMKSEAYLRDGQILIFSGGISRSRFTSDTNAAISCIETECSLLLKGTKVDGVYDSDPAKHPEARRFKAVPYKQCISDSSNYAFMDTTALVLLNNDKISTRVFNINTPESIMTAARGKNGIGTLVASQVEPEFY